MIRQMGRQAGRLKHCARNSVSSLQEATQEQQQQQQHGLTTGLSNGFERLGFRFRVQGLPTALKQTQEEEATWCRISPHWQCTLHWTGSAAVI
jgi:hypothetical protein